MAIFDPVPSEFLLTPEQASRVIPPEHICAGYVTPPALALDVLADSDREVHKRLLFLKMCGAELGGGIDGLFRSMREVVLERMGRHTDQVIAAACLHPDREATLDLPTLATVYLEANGSMEPGTLTHVRMVLGTLGMNALMNDEQNEAAVRAGEFYHYT